MERSVWVNGVHRPDGIANIDVDDEGFTLGRSVFETLRTYHGRIFALDDHIDRIAASASAMQVPLPDLHLLEAELLDCAETHGLKCRDVAIRLTLTTGGMRVIRAGEIPTFPSTMSCVTRLFVPPDWLDGTVKHCSRAYSRMAVLTSGVDEVLWVDDENHLLEGTRSNVFAIVDGQLRTPPVDGRFLAGVTRSFVLEAATEAGVPVKMGPLQSGEHVDALYLCSTLKEIIPVHSLDGRELGTESSAGSAVMAAFQDVLLDGLT